MGFLSLETLSLFFFQIRIHLFKKKIFRERLKSADIQPDEIVAIRSEARINLHKLKVLVFLPKKFFIHGNFYHFTT